MENINVETTHNVFLRFRPAGIGERILAYLVDVVILFLSFMVIIFAVGAIANIENTVSMILFFVFILATLTYPFWMETIFHGQTIGKMALKIKVMKLDGTEPTISSYLLRWLLGFVDFGLSSGAVAIISIVASKNNQRLGDMAANTTVINLKSKANISQSIFNDIPDDHQIQFPEVKKLNDGDINIAKEVLSAYRNDEPPPNIYEALDMVKYKLLQKMEISSDLPPVEFLRVIIKDYNKQYGKLA